MKSKQLFPFVLVVLVFILGCSDKVPLRGTVTFSDNGDPVPIGEVCFETPTSVSRGDIKPDGTYVVGTDGSADGIPKGTYNVVIYASQTTYTTNVIPGTNRTTETSQTKSLIHPKYNSPDSGLTFTVDGKKKTFDIKVDRP